METMTKRVTDRYNLNRFVQAQDWFDTYYDAIIELKDGLKVTHWIWFIFPRFIGEGYSRMGTHYAIYSRWEAKAYLKHPVLGTRLLECVRAVLANTDRTLVEIFGSVDAVKVRECAALFASLPGADPVFTDLFYKW